MAGDTNSEETIITAADDLVDWQENIILSYKHPRALNIMVSEKIIKHNYMCVRRGLGFPVGEGYGLCSAGISKTHRC